MEKIKIYLRNLSLRKSMALHIVLFVALAFVLGNLTAGVCEQASQRIKEKYLVSKDRYFLTNEAGEQLGEGAYIWTETDPMTESDKRRIDFLDALPMVMYPVYSALAVAAAAFLFYRSKLKAPLNLLTEASRKISQNELGVPVNYESRDEMGRLCESFEVMRSALEQNQLEMWRAVEERKRLNAAFAHDLRTPLTVLKGCNEMIQLTGGDKERAVADVMAKHIVRMEKYVDSMSRIQRLEDLQPAPQELCTEALLDLMKNSGAIFCEQKKKQFIFRSSVCSQQMKLDQELILQAFQNLLSNAARYARQCVTVIVTEREDGLRLTVQDDGIGFSPKALQNGLNPFYSESPPPRGGISSGMPHAPVELSCTVERCEAAHAGCHEKAEDGQDDADAEEHFGLGLYICKILCQRHGGYLEIGNTDSGAEVNLFFKKVR